MLVYITVHKDFSHPQVEKDTFQLDVESTTSIEDLKVLITLRYIDLGPDDFDLIQEYGNTKIVNKSKVHELLLGSDNPLRFMMIQRSKGCCCFIF
ncbi:unnamed protein product [Paramecium octaurelia]|uniref:Ubiquitin-like domain-containing protein n=1 Tax=Paramecium octaurelia TaxID=43137 RepID=A0A8S1UIV9_PAROT|nr:unnamed protein product [Paramecium octaurelia]